MDMNQVYAALDEMFVSGQTEAAEQFLIDRMKEAGQQEDYNALVMLLNEMIGYCRETGQKDKSIAYSSQVIELMQNLGLSDTVAYATTLLNVANALRAAGKLDEAYRFYMEVFPIYDKNLRPDDFYYASLYNNLSLLLQEMGDFEKAIECLQKALALALKTQGKEFEVYVTHANIASTLCMLAREEAGKEKQLGLVFEKPSESRAYSIAMEAKTEAEEAVEGFIHEGVKDQHMAAALTAYADACVLLGEYRDAVRYLKDARDMVLFCVGKTEAYDRIEEKLAYVEKLREGHVSGIELAEAYYDTYGKKMLFDNFGEYLDRIAVGICGEGSECLGYDDDISEDHDFGPGFCMWVTKQTYDEIGEKLQSAYDDLPRQFRGYTRDDGEQTRKRRGVCIIDDFFVRLLGMDHLPQTTQEWLGIPEEALLAATSGMVFTDPEGIFTECRTYLATYYPEEARRRLTAQHMTLFSQYGQYNYGRMLRRGDRATATFMLVKATEHAMHLCYLLNKKYAPHDKWLLRGLEDCHVLPMAEDILTTLLNNPDVHEMPEGMDRTQLVEKLAGMFLEEMKQQGILPKDAANTYLADYGPEVAYGRANQDEMKQENVQESVAYSKEELVDAIVSMEFKAFDQVKNEGGRADCQDNWKTFEIMRKSQYLTWDEEMLRQYLVDFKVSMDKGWNMITEKYARMMESTAPEQYEELASSLPLIPEEKKEIIEEIVRVQVGWMEDFAKRYPAVAGRARKIRTAEDTAYDTSSETYLRGEISTYSDEMLMLYGRFVASIAQKGGNLTEMTMENTVHMYGYENLDSAESKMEQGAADGTGSFSETAGCSLSGRP
ncbi:MAG: DUF4125 family protein [Lachnospiraceae bacterium]|nr:DUF4125 family protein [Lachnospiraceae bacterium]